MSEVPKKVNISKGLNFYDLPFVLSREFHLESVKEEETFHLIDKYCFHAHMMSFQGKKF